MTECFTPGGNCTEAIVHALGEAKRTVLVQAYSFTSAPIAKALLDAHKRGVQVQVILDKSQRTEKYSSADFLANQGVPTMIDANHAISHNKVMIIDGETVITGSLNFTKAAQYKNAENLLIIRDPALAAQYTTELGDPSAAQSAVCGPRGGAMKSFPLLVKGDRTDSHLMVDSGASAKQLKEQRI